VKFFLDENLPSALAQPVNVLFHKHVFRTSADEGLGGMKDIPLFNELRDRDFDVIITSDANQVVRNDPERRVLHDNKIHWIGVAQPATKGLHLLATWNANITAAMPHILSEINGSMTSPAWFSIKGVGIQATQRMNFGPLWRDKWGQRT
jgi:PIN domain-containing protein